MCRIYWGKYILVQGCASCFVFFYSWVGGYNCAFFCPDSQTAHPCPNYFLPQACTLLYSGLCNSAPCSSEGSLQNLLMPASPLCWACSALPPQCCPSRCPASLLPQRCSSEQVLWLPLSPSLNSWSVPCVVPPSASLLPPAGTSRLVFVCDPPPSFCEPHHSPHLA